MVEQVIDKQQRNQGRKIILTIVAIPVVIILISSILYYLADNKIIQLGTVNNGELLSPPVRFSELSMTGENNEPLDYTNPDPKWTFVVFGDRYCQGACEKMLYLSRQTHTALAKRMTQVRRYYVTTDSALSPELQKTMSDEYKNVTVVKVNKQELDGLLADSNIDTIRDNRFYVVDQRGWLMMHYTADDLKQEALNDLGKKVIKDMKRLLN